MRFERDEKGHVYLGKLEWVIELLIVLSLVSIAVETIPRLPPRLRGSLRLLEIVTVAIFTLEYLARLILSRPRFKYAVSFYGLVDLAAILPFYLTSGVDLRSVRALRFFRLFRMLKLTRYSTSFRRINRAFYIARDDLLLFGIASLILLYLSAVVIYYFEHRVQPEVFTSVIDSLWWALSTLTPSLAFDEGSPVTLGGRIFTFFVVIIGLGLIAIPTGVIASALAKARQETEETDAGKAEGEAK